ncbi:MAG: hypothetical protein AAB316_00405 [Bacteroidota bacterium]
MKIILLILCLIAAAIAICIYWLNRVSTVSKETQYGPFVIRANAATGKTFNINYGMVNSTRVSYSIWYDGKPVEFPGSLQTNTGLPFLWKVYALSDAPEPTLLAGSQSLYLVYLKAGKPVVEPLVVQGHDFASLQFLDSEAGQPGKETEVYSMSQTEGMEKLDSLQGGNLLLVSGKLVLDVRTRQQWQFNKDNNSVENYSFPSPPGALAFSPDRKNIVFHGEFQSWNTPDEELPDSEHGIVVYNYEKDTGYPVIYDDTETRMTNLFEININWFNDYFEWKKDANGDDRLQLISLDKPRNWLGKYSDNYYYLYPVKASMHPVFLDFVFRQMGWTKANILEDKFHEYTGRQLLLGDNETKLDLVFKEDEQQISFSKHLYLPDTAEDTKYRILVKKIADAFDAELASGKHQEHFGKVINETKRIRAL